MQGLQETGLTLIFGRIPAPSAPPTAAITDVIGDAVAISIVCFVINISMAKLFATKYKYQISPNQVGRERHWLLDDELVFLSRNSSPMAWETL